jgi:hypothetical protein
LGDKVIKARLISGAYSNDFFFEIQKENGYTLYSIEIILEESQ